MPGYSGDYAKIVSAHATQIQAHDVPDGQILRVNNPQQGVTEGGVGDYLVLDGKGNQYIVPKAKFEGQYAKMDAGAEKALEPMHIPSAYGPPLDMGAGVTSTPWEHGYVLRDTEKNQVQVVNTEDGSYKLYKEGRLSQERRVTDTPAGNKVQDITYPYGDVESVSKLPTPEEYAAILIRTQRLWPRGMMPLAESRPWMILKSIRRNELSFANK